MATIEVWQEDGAITCARKSCCDEMRANGDIEPGASLLHTFEAATYLEMMTRHYELMGFGPYKPLRLESGEIDPLYLEPL